MASRIVSFVFAFGLLAAACGDSDDPIETEDDRSTASSVLDSSSSGSLIPTATSEGDNGSTQVTTGPAASVTTEAPQATTTAPPTTLPVSSDATLTDGQPATWFGVRDTSNSSHVEERDTLDGSLKRELTSVSLPSEWAPVSLDVNNDRIAIGYCCEPVSGDTQILRRIDGVEIVSASGSEPVFAPNPPHLITVGYADGGLYALVNSNSGVAVELPIVAANGDRAAWNLDGTQIALEVGTGIAIAFFDPELNEVVDVGPTLQPPAGATWSKPTFQASGDLVVAQDTGGASSGVVLDQTVFAGAAGNPIKAEFMYGGTVVHQLYDDAGVFLIYVLDDGSVRWLGEGDQGELAAPGSGHIAAAW